ncbi:MAG: response regulator transcription factor [Anaerolineaceae bacterium]|nr:response regulator transcription factor [Anaerolineaceae bacterium]
MKPIRVVVIDRNDITRKGVEAIIGDAGAPFEVLTAFARLREVDRYFKEQGEDIDVVILDDYTIHPKEVTNLVALWHRHFPDLGVIVLSQRRQSAYIQDVMRWGNASFILKNGDVQEQLLRALQLISSKYPFISPAAFRLMNCGTPAALDPQDWDVLRLTEQGLRAQAISDILGISRKTVYRVRARLKQRLGVSNNENLVDAARKQGLLENKD